MGKNTNCLNEVLLQIADIESERFEPDPTSIWDFEAGQVMAMQFMLDKVFGEEE